MERHITVLTTEAVEALAINTNSTVVDATLGSLGHAREILSRLGAEGTFIGIDADRSVISTARGDLKGKPIINLHEGNFRQLDSILNGLYIQDVDAILADLGWRMEQFSGNGKGFSFNVDEPLIMTFGEQEEYPFTATDIVNDWDEIAIRNVIKGYGEERFAYKIARSIVNERKKAPIRTTFELSRIIESAVPNFYAKNKLHPATRTFQALRIAVNDEFDALSEFIHQGIARLTPNGRFAIISFHSLEDRIVKHTFRAYKDQGVGTVLTKKPITASEEEQKANPRSRSAKLRIFVKH